MNGARCAALTLVLQDCLEVERRSLELVGERRNRNKPHKSLVAHENLEKKMGGLKVDVKEDEEYEECEDIEVCEEATWNEVL